MKIKESTTEAPPTFLHPSEIARRAAELGKDDNRGIKINKSSVGDVHHSPGDLEKIYARRFAGAEQYRDKVWKILTSRIFAKWVSPNDTVLDLGSGYCEFVNNIPARVKYAMDLNPVTRKHASSEVKVISQDCSLAWTTIAPGKLDAVFTSNFFEHLPDKEALKQTVIHAFSGLKPGGRLIALGPNIHYLNGSYWDFYDHYVPLSHFSLIELLENCGFSIEYARAKFLPYTMSQGHQPPLWMLKAYLGLPLAWSLFGKQFLVVARKPREPAL
jgi:hypothetical protein